MEWVRSGRAALSKDSASPSFSLSFAIDISHSCRPVIRFSIFSSRHIYTFYNTTATCKRHIYAFGVHWYMSTKTFAFDIFLHSFVVMHSMANDENAYLPLKFLMTNFRISFGLDDPFVGILIGGPLLLLTAEKFGRFLPFSSAISNSLFFIEHTNFFAQHLWLRLLQLSLRYGWFNKLTKKKTKKIARGTQKKVEYRYGAHRIDIVYILMFLWMKFGCACVMIEFYFRYSLCSKRMTDFMIFSFRSVKLFIISPHVTLHTHTHIQLDTQHAIELVNERAR